MRLPYLLSKTYIPKNTPESETAGIKIQKDRCTILFGGNASGDYKLKPFLIHKAKNPRCFTKNKIVTSQLPVHYRFNKTAWMSKLLFKDWFENCFIPNVKNYCKRKNIAYKILLVLDNATGHGKELANVDENVKIVFLPPNTTSLIQPMDQGLIATFKVGFKHLLMTQAIKVVDGRTTNLIQFLKKITILDAIKLIDKAWQNVPKSAAKEFGTNFYSARNLTNQMILTKMPKLIKL